MNELAKSPGPYFNKNEDNISNNIINTNTRNSNTFHIYKAVAALLIGPSRPGCPKFLNIESIVLSIVVMALIIGLVIPVLIAALAALATPIPWLTNPGFLCLRLFPTENLPFPIKNLLLYINIIILCNFRLNLLYDF